MPRWLDSPELTKSVGCQPKPAWLRSCARCGWACPSQKPPRGGCKPESDQPLHLSTCRRAVHRPRLRWIRCGSFAYAGNQRVGRALGSGCGRRRVGTFMGAFPTAAFSVHPISSNITDRHRTTSSRACVPDRSQPPVRARSMQSQELQTLPKKEFPATRVDVHSPIGVRTPGILAAVSCSDKPVLAGRRIVYAAMRERMVDEIHARSLRDLTAVEARTG